MDNLKVATAQFEHKSGDMMAVTVLRDGKERSLTLRIP